ncbi:uncharacterized protein LOC132196812 [Neocloeon triangulifer]|uniref:uncharacterized protein LOC132196812 n=1 Tax=Neocloeon triangulifer TaxID=2078957 RepID=UPI00286EB5A4|nr:uncharacterized protein LOC132196812 [Neocloeon triangulifer]
MNRKRGGPPKEVQNTCSLMLEEIPNKFAKGADGQSIRATESHVIAASQQKENMNQGQDRQKEPSGEMTVEKEPQTRIVLKPEHQVNFKVKQLLPKICKKYGRPEDLNTTQGKALVSIASMYQKLSKDRLSSIISNVIQFLPDKPDAVDAFLKSVTPNIIPHKITLHCSDCLNDEIQSYKCVKCGSSAIAVNLQNDLADIIKNLFEHHHLYNLISESKGQHLINNEEVSDVCDSDKYRKLSKDRGPYDLSLVINTSGLSAFGSPTAKVWPLFFTIAEVPIHHRKRFVMLSNLWYAPIQKPNLNEFMGPFVAVIKNLKTVGVNWTHPETKELHNSKISVHFCVADAQSRATLMNLNKPNELFGCSRCEIPGQRGKYNVIYPYSETSFPTRTSGNTQEHSFTLQQTSCPEEVQRRMSVGLPDLSCILGVKGTSAMTHLPEFNLGRDLLPDYIETCLLGVVKNHLKVVFDPANSEQEFYIGDAKTLNKRLKEIEISSIIGSPPRDFLSVDTWTAKDFKNWLLYFSLPFFKSIWSEKYYRHFRLLVIATYTLSKTKINLDEQAFCFEAITEFRSCYGDLYGSERESMEVHMLSHLCSSVYRFGPLFSHSALMFEDANKIIKHRIGTAPKKVHQRLLKMAKLQHSFQTLTSVCDPKTRTLFLGHPIPHSSIPAEILELVRRLENHSSVIFYHSINFRGLILTCSTRTQDTNSNSNFVLYKNKSQLKAANVLFFCKLQSKFSSETLNIFVGREVKLSELKGKTVFQKYEEEKEIVWSQIFFIESPLINITIPPSENYFGVKVMCVPPNLEDI